MNYNYFWLIALISSFSIATEKVDVKLITTPIYHLWEDAEVRLVGIPRIGWDLDLEQCAYFYTAPYGVIKGREIDPLARDINLISVYKINIEAKHDKDKWYFAINLKDAQKPKGYKFSIDEVVEFAYQAIKTDYPTDAIKIIGKTDQ